MRDEIRSRVPLKTLTGLVKFIPIAASLHAQAVNIAGIAQDCGVETSDVIFYLEVLEGVMATTLLPSYKTSRRTTPEERSPKQLFDKGKKSKSRSSAKQRFSFKNKSSARTPRNAPKLYWIDPGLIRTFNNQTGPVPEEEKEHLLEGWVLGLLRVYNEHFNNLYEDISYWSSGRSQTTTVTFLITRDGWHIAIDVSNVNEYNTEMLDGLRSVASLQGLTRSIAIYTGNEIISEDNIEVWPLDKFHETLHYNQLWN